jgi:hypothetical protein
MVIPQKMLPAMTGIATRNVVAQRFLLQAVRNNAAAAAVGFHDPLSTPPPRILKTARKEGVRSFTFSPVDSFHDPLSMPPPKMKTQETLKGVRKLSSDDPLDFARSLQSKKVQSVTQRWTSSNVRHDSFHDPLSMPPKRSVHSTKVALKSTKAMKKPEEGAHADECTLPSSIPRAVPRKKFQGIARKANFKNFSSRNYSIYKEVEKKVLDEIFGLEE